MRLQQALISFGLVVFAALSQPTNSAATTADTAFNKLASEVTTLHNEVTTLRDEVAQLRAQEAKTQAMIETFALSARPSVTPERAKEIEDEIHRELPTLLQPPSPLSKCTEAAKADLEKLANPDQRSKLTADEVQRLVALQADCTTKVLCGSKSGDDQKKCEKEVDEGRKILALLLRLAAIGFAINGDFETAFALMMAADALGKGDGDGDGDGKSKGSGDHPVPNPSPTIQPAPTPVPPKPPCEVCEEFGKIPAEQNGLILTVHFTSGTKVFNLGKISAGAFNLQFDHARGDRLSANDADQTLTLYSCANAKPAGSEYSGPDVYTLKPRDSDVQAVHERSNHSIHGSCSGK